ncbi:MAG: tRNA pseudouridine(38-40) synthase TruA [Planctomycetia bacterium]|nr:tRNA pseudouridine(38-40) synthase TruA [Planctomycetia bacterium]
MRNIRLTVAYDGTDFHGWQYQKGNTIRTVQGVLVTAMEKLTGGTLEAGTFQILGSSRTDTGVHALGQVASVWTESAIPIDSFARALNANLPGDAFVVKAEEVPLEFHPIQDTERKRYRYLIQDGPAPELFLRRYAWRMGKLTATRLDAEKMAEGARYLLGTHDFSALENIGSPRTSSVRTILDVSVRRGTAEHRDREERESLFLPLVGRAEDFIEIEVEADGFLYNMVRNIAGTLMEVGRGTHSPEWLGELVESRNRALAGPTAPPQGLYLLWIRFAKSGKKTDFCENS